MFAFFDQLFGDKFSMLFTMLFLHLLFSFSFKFKSFSYLYDEEQFILSLKHDVIIVKSLPENLKAGRRKNEFPIFRPKSSASPHYYTEEILPKLKKANVIGLVLTDGGCLQVITCSSFSLIFSHFAIHASYWAWIFYSRNISRSFLSG